MVDLDSSDLLEIRDQTSLKVLASYQYLGQPVRLIFGATDVFLLHIVNNQLAFIKMPFMDQDQDGLPKWWEQLYGLSDSNPADASGDLDNDGVTNRDEFKYFTNPLLADTDSDGLTDYQEIVTYKTDPNRADMDGDGLSDRDEVITYGSNPLKSDTDNDGYSDLIEVQYSGDPNDPTVLPKPMVTFTESFENNPNLTGWFTPTQSNANWSIDLANSNTGTKSLRSGVIGNSQQSSIQLRALFSSGLLEFYSKIDSEQCCDRLHLLIDNNEVGITALSNQWTKVSAPITLGVHNIEWRYQKDGSASQGADVVWIDDISFSKQ